MTRKITNGIFLFILLLTINTANAQMLKPRIEFEEDPRTHNMHITSDGKYFYTVNGGVADKGQINKFTPEGKLLNTYDIKLDMRSIMYNEKDKRFYVCSYDKNIYRITDLEYGKYEPVLSEFYESEQATLAMSPDGKYIYYFDNGTLNIYKFPSGKPYKTLTGFDKGSEYSTGSCAVAVDSKYIYTWNADYKIIFVYDMKGKKVKSVQISKGEYGFSLSCAKGMIFVSTDGNYTTGTWYGYDIWSK